ncbi:hypothetical protein GS3922_00405 [Geobacillus subterraneus]|uniref:Uncharacterized protein n=2 Tax=Geobacillus TaxID=129337 RepID=A0ABM6A7S1_9BACL|nr:hypothetical protein GS3922_00405 [Geobacillus subterraneus]KZS24534.1 hypothetical protein A5418_00740 [Geobacillus subterraneus]OXB91319.1 hypothetical protein B9L21_00235 [Geobacillus uzenensis]
MRLFFSGTREHGRALGRFSIGATSDSIHDFFAFPLAMIPRKSRGVDRARCRRDRVSKTAMLPLVRHAAYMESLVEWNLPIE